MYSLILCVAMTAPGGDLLDAIGGIVTAPRRVFGSQYGSNGNGYGYSYSSGCSGNGNGCSGASYGCNGSAAYQGYPNGYSAQSGGKWVWHPDPAPMNAKPGPTVEEIVTPPKKVNAVPKAGVPAVLTFDAPNDAVILIGKEMAARVGDCRFEYKTQPLTDDFDWRCRISATITRNGREEVERNVVMVTPGERKALAVMTALKKSNDKNLAAK